MNSHTDETACPFNAQEREYIRRELDLFFGTLPSVADGFQLRTWRSGPLAGQPKLPPALRTMVDSGLMEIRTDTPLPRAYFTKRGLGALRGDTGSRRCTLTASGLTLRQSCHATHPAVLPRIHRSARCE